MPKAIIVCGEKGDRFIFEKSKLGKINLSPFLVHEDSLSVAKATY